MSAKVAPIKAQEFYKVESGIQPGPAVYGTPARNPAHLALAQLKVGESFLVPFDNKIHKVYTYAYRRRIRIMVRKEANGRRVFRIE